VSSDLNKYSICFVGLCHVVVTFRELATWLFTQQVVIITVIVICPIS